MAARSEPMAADLVTVSVEPSGLARLTLQGHKGNAISPSLLDGFESALGELERSRPEVLLVESRHPKAFMVGGDLDVLGEWSASGRLAEAWAELAARMGELLWRLGELPAFTVAVVDGDAVGGGFELALCCDYRIAARGVRFGFPENRLGVFPSAGSLPRLGELVGPGVALRLVLTGEMISAKRAAELGIVETLAEADAERDAGQLADSVLRWGTAPLRTVREEVRGRWRKEDVHDKMMELLGGISNESFRARLDHQMRSRKSGGKG